MDVICAALVFAANDEYPDHAPLFVRYRNNMAVAADPDPWFHVHWNVTVPARQVAVTPVGAAGGRAAVAADPDAVPDVPPSPTAATSKSTFVAAGTPVMIADRTFDAAFCHADQAPALNRVRHTNPVIPDPECCQLNVTVVPDTDDVTPYGADGGYGDVTDDDTDCDVPPTPTAATSMSAVTPPPATPPCVTDVPPVEDHPDHAPNATRVR
jgi:hypothetical protein